MKRIVLFSLVALSNIVSAQQKTATTPKINASTNAAKPALTVDKAATQHQHNEANGVKHHTRTVNVEQVKTGLQTFIWHTDDSNLPKIVEGGTLSMHARLFNKECTTVLNDFGFMPDIPIQKQNFGFMYEGILKMTPGDSAIFKVSADSMYGKQMPPFATSGDVVCYSFSSYTKEQAELRKKVLQAEQEKKQKEQVGIDEKKLKDYFSANGITGYQRTNEGLYYTITKQGSSEMAKSGDQMVVNYSGKLLDGKPFDSNVDTAFHHVQPFTFKLNQHQVIPGWDIGFGHFTKGTKATLYIPSYLAYGERAQGPIPANSPLIFDVELLDIVSVVDPSKQFDKYFAENHIKAEKTPEGLYYVITQQGTGEKPKAGQTVIANYTGKLTNGSVFDSNTDLQFHHQQPFSFALGQHMVISGWDIGFGLLNKGAKATLYIPSNLGYGEQGQGAIPANAPLIFDVELLDIK